MKSREQRLLAVCLSAAVLLGFALPAPAPLENRDTLKTYFETGDIPTQDQFADLIDSFIDLQFDYGPGPDQHSVTALRGGILTDAGGNALRLREGDLFDPGQQGLLSTGALGATSDWPGQSGFLAFRFDIIDNGITTTHNGFAQMSVDGPATATPYAIRLVAIGYETTPGVPVTMTNIPEPASLALLLLGGMIVSRRPGGLRCILARCQSGAFRP